MGANVNLIPANLGNLGVTDVIIDTNLFIELIDPKAKHKKDVEDFFNHCATNSVNMYITPTIHGELLNISQRIYTNEYAKTIQLNPKDSRYYGNKGFKQLQEDISQINPNYFPIVAKQREALISTVLSITDILSEDENHHIEVEKLQNKLCGVIEESDTAIILTGSNYGINTIATGDYGFSHVDQVNVLAIQKGKYYNHSSTNILVPHVDLI